MAEQADEKANEVRVPAGALRDFCAAAFERLDVAAEDAWVTADVLVEADRRGIASHGVARLRRYVNGLRDGMMRARPPAAGQAPPCFLLWGLRMRKGNCSTSST